MKVSLSWLQDYVAIEMEVNKLAEALTMTGLEVEAVIQRFEYLKDVLVGRIIEIKPHPGADRLKLCQVDTGSRILPVVCGALNIRVGMKAPLAMIGAHLPNNKPLKKGIIRGEISEGMLCSAGELGIGLDISGVHELDSTIEIGLNLCLALDLDDTVFEIGLTPNRPDCLSIIGIAREIASLQNVPLKLPQYEIPAEKGDINTLSSVKIQDINHCPRYSARLLEDIIIEPSPFWLADRLISVGLRPINNIVDITNFVMMETGQPLHAFDFDLLAENKIIVRTAGQGEKFKTLDNKEYLLTEEMLLICDGKQPVAIGGVMGGLNSEINQNTRRVFLESAYFNPASIRRTSKKLGLSTDAAYRFERGVDPFKTVAALNRAAVLMAKISKGKLIAGFIDEYPDPPSIQPINLSVSQTNRILGTKLAAGQIEQMLKSIEFKVDFKDPDTFTISPPTFRVDVLRPEDLMEEVARLSGYNQIPTTFPHIPAEARTQGGLMALRNKLKDLLTGLGFNEVINYTFIHGASCDRLNLKSDDPRRNLVKIVNPLTEDQAVLRTSLIPGLLENIRNNIAQQTADLKLFEAGKIFIAKGTDELPVETEILAGLWTGNRIKNTWYSKPVPSDFFDIKGAVEGLLSGIKMRDLTFTAMRDSQCTYTRFGHTAKIFDHGQELGLVGEIQPSVLKQYDINQPVFIFEIDLDILLKRIPLEINAEPLPKYPSVSRDITLIVDQDIEVEKILTGLMDLKENLVESLHLFDIFEGDSIPENKKSVSFRVTYRSSMTTLKDETINQLHQELSGKLITKFNALLPG